MGVHEYFEYMSTNEIEHKLLYGVHLCALVCGVLYLVSSKATSGRELLRNVLLSLVYTSTFFITTHYQNDITHLNGE